MTLWSFFPEMHRRGEVRRVDWQTWLTKGPTIVFASGLARLQLLA